MKKALIPSLLLWMGLFSFADASVVYQQPFGTYTATSTITATLSSTPTRSATWTATAIQQVGGGNVVGSIGITNTAAYIPCVYNITDGTHIACATTQTGTGSQVNFNLTLVTANQGGATIVGKVYALVFISVDGTPDDSAYLVNSSNEMMVSIFDTEGGFAAPNWGAISVVPPIDFAALQFVATSTSFFSGQASGTLQAIANECAQSGNIFAEALCRTAAYLFIPNPAVLDQYTGLGSTTAEKFPFSYIFGVIGLFTGLTASSTTNMISPHIDFASVDPASSTPFGPFLPDATILSSSTIKQYMPTGFWEFIYFLMSATIWLGLAFMLVREAFRMINVRHD